jgi:nucleoside phosphorylase
MKILIVEDNNGKAQKIVECILEGTSLTREHIDICFTVSDAKVALRANIYDLMILDVVVPFRGGEAPKSENSEALLIELRDRTTLKKPRQIIGLTAFEDGYVAAEPVFSQQSWAIIRFRPDSNEWKEQIARSVAYLGRVGTERENATYRTDVAIISALEMPEHDAVRRSGWNWSAPEPLDDTTFYQRATFRSGDREFSAVSSYCQKFGMVSAALLSAKLIEAVRPRLLVMPGICAGVREKVNYGDVIIADPCWDWQVGKHLVKDGEKEFAIQPEQLPLQAHIRSKWDQLRVDRAFWTSVRDGWRDAPETELKARIGPAVSGSAVLADADIVERIKEQHRGLLAVEMEAFGVLAAAQIASHPRPAAFTCKAVCDFADDKKDDRWQSYAAYTSVAAMTEFLERYLVDMPN